MSAVDIRVVGNVQGVYFRASCCEKAQELQLCGYVKNDPDGSVFVHAEGEQDQLDELYRWCQKGPQTANVLRVEVEKGTVEGFQKFEIRGPSASSEVPLVVQAQEDESRPQSCC